jgi:PDDEXK-like domain of unknown function (DUF3799)
MNFGKILNEPSEVYHSAAAFGIHDLADLSPYPVRFKLKHIDHATKDQDSPALQFGRFLHCLALEGEEAAAARFVPAPDVDRRTKAGKDAWAAFESHNAGREIVSQLDSDLAWAMVKAVRNHKTAAALFNQGQPEVTFRYQMKHFAVQCRCDWYDESDKAAPIIVDLKSIEKLEDFDRQFLNFGYYRQAAFYRQVVKSVLKIDADPQFIFVVVEKQEPHLVQVVAPDAQSLAVGWQECERDLMTLKGCMESGIWPGAPEELTSISLPKWKLTP